MFDTRCHNTGNSTSSDFMKASRQTLTGRCSQRNSHYHQMLIAHRQLSYYFLGSRLSYSPSAQSMHMTLNMSLFDNYQQVACSLLRPRTVHWTESWCWLTVMIMLKNSVWLQYKILVNHLPARWTSGRQQPPKPQILQQPTEYPQAYVPSNA